MAILSLPNADLLGYDIQSSEASDMGSLWVARSAQITKYLGDMKIKNDCRRFLVYSMAP